jgi:hypothetical protein
MIRPRLFVGSSSEGLAVAQAVQSLLDSVAEVSVCGPRECSGSPMAPWNR